jgi:hypothetical protein
VTGLGAEVVDTITDTPSTGLLSDGAPDEASGDAPASAFPQTGFARSELAPDRPVDSTLPVLVLLRESATACGLRIGRLSGLPLRLDWVDSWRAPAQTAQRTAAWWWPFGMGSVSAAVGLTGEAVAFLADVFLGGDGSGVTDETVSGELEIAILSRQLGACFQPLEFLESPVESQDFPSAVGLGAPAAQHLPVQLEVSDALMIRLALNDPTGHHGDVLLMLPARSLLGGDGPTRAPGHRPGNAIAPPAPDTSTSGAVHGVPVTVHFRLPAVSLSALDVAGLEAGDVVRLNGATTVDGFLTGEGVAGARILSGALGQRDGHLAVQVHALTLESQ